MVSKVCRRQNGVCVLYIQEGKIDLGENRSVAGALMILCLPFLEVQKEASFFLILVTHKRNPCCDPNPQVKEGEAFLNTFSLAECESVQPITTKEMNHRHGSSSGVEQTGDLYAVLELRPNATRDDIRRQYKRLALKYHPDKNTDATAGERRHAEVMFKAVARAYEILSDDERRKQYDLYGEEDGQRDSNEQRSSQRPRQHQPQSTRDGGGSRQFGGPSAHFTTSSSSHFSGFPNPASTFTSDPFFAGIFEPLGRGGSGAPRHWGGAGGMFSPFSEEARRSGGGRRMPSSIFDAFLDPFELFEQIMNEEFMPFHPSQQHHHPAPRGNDRGGSMRGGSNIRALSNPFELFTQFGMMDPFGMSAGGSRGGAAAPQPHHDLMLGGGSFTSSFSSMTVGGGSGGIRQSVSTVTEIRDGQRVTKTVRRTQDGSGVVHEDVDEEVAHLPSGGPTYARLPSVAAAAPPGSQQFRSLRAGGGGVGGSSRVSAADGFHRW